MRLLGLKVAAHRGDGTRVRGAARVRARASTPRIDWKHSARHRKLLVKEFRTERNHQVVLAFDTGHLMREPIARLPAARPRDQRRRCCSPGSPCAPATSSACSASTPPRAAVAGPAAACARSPRSSAPAPSSTIAATRPTTRSGSPSCTPRLRRRALVVLFTDFVDTVTAELMIDNLRRARAPPPRAVRQSGTARCSAPLAPSRLGFDDPRRRRGRRATSGATASVVLERLRAPRRCTASTRRRRPLGRRWSTATSTSSGGSCCDGRRRAVRDAAQQRLPARARGGPGASSKGSSAKAEARPGHAGRASSSACRCSTPPGVLALGRAQHRARPRPAALSREPEPARPPASTGRAGLARGARDFLVRGFRRPCAAAGPPLLALLVMLAGSPPAPAGARRRRLVERAGPGRAGRDAARPARARPAQAELRTLAGLANAHGFRQRAVRHNTLIG